MEEEKEVVEAEEVKQEATEVKEVKEEKKKKENEKTEVKRAEVDKAKVLKEIKEYNFCEKDRNNLELMEAIKNATEENLSFVEHRAILQVAHMDMDVTCEGYTDTMRRTINPELTSGKHVWLIEGDWRNAQRSEIINDFSPNRESAGFKDITDKYGNEVYVYQKGKEHKAARKVMLDYANSYFRKLNMTCSDHNSRVNDYQIYADSEPYENKYWDIYFTYTTSKGKVKKIPFGNVRQMDMSNDTVVIPMAFENFYTGRNDKRNKVIGAIAGVVGALLLAGIIIAGIILG